MHLFVFACETPSNCMIILNFKPMRSVDRRACCIHLNNYRSNCKFRDLTILLGIHKLSFPNVSNIL